MFNVFNSQAVQDRNEIGEQSGLVPLTAADAAAGFTAADRFYPINPNYGQPTVYQTPRRVRVGLDIEF